MLDSILMIRRVKYNIGIKNIFLKIVVSPYNITLYVGEARPCRRKSLRYKGLRQLSTASGVPIPHSKRRAKRRIANGVPILYYRTILVYFLNQFLNAFR